MNCAHCHEIILGHEPTMTSNGGALLWHHECFLRLIVGPVAHIEKRCGCFVPGSQEMDPPGLTLREAAVAAFVAYKKSSYLNFVHENRN